MNNPPGPTFPIWPSEPAVAPTSAVLAALAGGEAPVVVCLEGARRMREILDKVLSRLPVHSLLAATVAEALEIVRCVHPSLLIIDLNVPEISGWQALADLRRAAGPEDLRVIVLTARDSPHDYLLAVNVAQVDVFLRKPCDAGELADHVLRLLDLPSRLEGFDHAAQDGNGTVSPSA